MHAHQLVLDADAHQIGLVHAGLVGHDHARAHQGGVAAVQGVGAFVDVAHKADAVAGAAAVVDQVLPQRFTGDGVDHMAVAVVQPDSLGDVDVALQGPGVELALVLGQLTQRVGAGDVGGAVHVGGTAVHQQKALALELCVVLRGGVVVHHGCVAAVGRNGAKALHDELIRGAAVLVQDLVHGQLGQLFAGFQTLFQLDLEPHHRHSVAQVGFLVVGQLHFVLHALHGQQRVGQVLHGEGGVVLQHLIHGIVHGGALCQHGLGLGLSGHEVQHTVVLGQGHTVGFQFRLCLRGHAGGVDEQHGAVRGNIAVGHGVGGALDVHGAQVQQPGKVVQLAHQLGGAAQLGQLCTQLAQLFGGGEACVFLGQDPGRGGGQSRAALGPQLILQEQGLNGGVLGFQRLLHAVHQRAAGGQTAQAQLAALRHHLGAVFLHGGHARLTHLHQLDLGACDLLLGLHKVTAVGPDSTLGHGDHKVGVFTMEAGEVGQGGVVVGQVLTGVGAAHRDQVHVHTVCLHGGAQGGQPFGNCIHAHRKAFFLIFAGRTSGGGGLLLHIVAFRRKECNAGVSPASCGGGPPAGR